MKHNLESNKVIVQDINGNEISTMYANRAVKYIFKRKAVPVSDNPPTIRLLNEIKDKCETNEG